MNTEQEEQRTRALQTWIEEQEDEVFTAAGGLVCIRNLPASCSCCGARGATTVVVWRREKRYLQHVHDHIAHREGCEVGHERTA